jgi:hypothetical protein
VVVKLGAAKVSVAERSKVFEDKELCGKAPEPPCEPDVTSDELFRPSAATGTWTFTSGGGGWPGLGRTQKPGVCYSEQIQIHGCH